MKYFISDTHFSHNNIIKWERNNFKTIEEHDKYLINVFTDLAIKLNKDKTNELFVLGDWGSTDYLYLMDMFECKTIFVFGNHDSKNDENLFRSHFDEVYLYPIFLSNKLVISHMPVAVYDDTINICGHLHKAELSDINHICVSIHTLNYIPFTDKQLDKYYQKIPKYNRRFLWEPWAIDYNFLNFPREDIIYNSKTGVIDLSATRLLKKINGK